MIEEIIRSKPKGATHWQDGRYFMKTSISMWFEFADGDWVFVNRRVNGLCMTQLRD